MRGKVSRSISTMSRGVSSATAYVTGAAFVVDGGLLLTNWFEPPALEDL